MAISARRRLRQNWSLRDVSTVGGQDQSEYAVNANNRDPINPVITIL